MKGLYFFILFISFFSFSQEKPFNIILSDKQIQGNADKTSVVKIDINGGEEATYNIIVNYVGYFEFQFPKPLIINDKPISIWAEVDGKKSEIIKLIPKTDSELLSNITNGTLLLPYKKIQEDKEEPKKEGPIIFNPLINETQPKNTTYKFKTSIISTNFTIPVARFNTVSNSDTKVGDISLFNSIGAGVGYCWGELERTTNENNETVNSEFTSTFGYHIGVLFSAGSGQDSKNVFAPTISFSILDFQFGYGFELGTIEDGQKRDFWTVAYAIPISKLLKGKYYVVKSTRGYNATNPLQEIDNEKKDKKTEIFGYN